MSSEVYALALKSALKEIQNACPVVTSNLLFKDNKISARGENTTEEQATKTIKAFYGMNEKSAPIGKIESITIHSAKGKVNIDTVKDWYSTTVLSKRADEKYVNTLTRTLIPIVINLVEEIQPAPTDSEPVTVEEVKPEEDAESDTTFEEIQQSEENETDHYYAFNETQQSQENETDHSYEEETAEETTTANLDEPEQKDEPEFKSEPLLPEPPVTQLIVEHLGGLLVPSDTVRVDEEVIEQWKELYGDKKIDEVEVEALNGKTTRCKFREIKKSKDAGRGLIKMPEKIQLALETTQGELVTVKPIVE
jgi:hypothetical protein